MSSTRIDSQLRATRAQCDDPPARAPRTPADQHSGAPVRRRCAYAAGMAPQVSEAQSEILHEQIVPAFLEILDDAPALEDPAELEQLAATVLVALAQPDMPADAVSAVLAAIEARRNPDAAGVLAAIAVLAAEPLAAQAAAGAQRLAGDGIASPAGAALGMLAVQEAVRIEGAGVELLVALLRRPGARVAQPAMLAIEHEHTGGTLVQCALAPPARFTDARELLHGIDGAGAPAPVVAGELAARAVTAARRAVEQDIALGHEAGPALPIVSRALTGDPAGLPRPVVLAPWEDDDPELTVDPADDEDGFQRVMEMLLAELEQHAKATYPPDSVVWEHGDFVASTMLQWKGGYDDGRLGRWTRPDLAEYLLDYFPRKVSVDDETLAACPTACARSWASSTSAAASPANRSTSSSTPSTSCATRSASAPATTHSGASRNRWSCRCKPKASTPAHPARSTPGSPTSTRAYPNSANRSSAPPPTA